VTFAGKSVLVTGAAKGIGQAAARRFAALGASVALLDRDADALRLAAAAGSPESTLLLTADIAVAHEAAEAVATVIDRFGGIDVLVNNAGIHFARALDEYTDEEWNRIFSVNVHGTFHMIRSALPALRGRHSRELCVSGRRGHAAPEVVGRHATGSRGRAARAGRDAFAQAPGNGKRNCDRDRVSRITGCILHHRSHLAG